MDGDRFNRDWFGLRVPTIDIIVDAILSMEGIVTLAKIDVAHAFHNLCADRLIP